MEELKGGLGVYGLLDVRVLDLRFIEKGVVELDLVLGGNRFCIVEIFF